MTPEAAAVLAAHAPLAHCHKQGCQVTVAVVDRSGLLQALVRDRFAGAHTVEAATNKAWTAASFKLATAALAQETQAGKPMSGSRAHRMCWRRGGGLPIEVGGVLPGGTGISGAHGGDVDDACAQAGSRAITESLEF